MYIYAKCIWGRTPVKYQQLVFISSVYSIKTPFAKAETINNPVITSESSDNEVLDLIEENLENEDLIDNSNQGEVLEEVRNDIEILEDYGILGCANLEEISLQSEDDDGITYSIEFLNGVENDVQASAYKGELTS